MRTVWSGLNVKLISLLLICCLVLASIVLAEWLYAGYSFQNLLASIENTEEVPSEIETLPEIKLAEKSMESYSAMVSRPLFTEGRKPIEDEEIAPVQNFSGNIELILTGIVEAPEGVTAMLQDNNNKHYRAREGEEAEGWEVLSIEADKVVVANGGNKKELMLRKPRPELPLKPKTKPPRRAMPKRPRTPSSPTQQSMPRETDDQL